MILDIENSILTLILLPILNIFSVNFLKNKKSLQSKINNLIPAISLIFSAILFVNINESFKNDISFELTNDIYLSFIIDKTAILLILTLNILWLIFIIYLQRFLNISNSNLSHKFLQVFLYIIFALTILAVANNLIALFLIFQIFAIIFYFYSHDFLHKKTSKTSHFFSAILHLQALIFLISAIYGYHIFNSLNINLIFENLNKIPKLHAEIFIVSFLAPTLIFILIPFYLLYRKINLNPIIIIVAFFFLFFLSNSFLIIKFYYQLFAKNIISTLAFNIFEVLFLLNIMVISCFLFFSRNIKSSFFYFYFYQAILNIYSSLFLLYSGSKLYFIPLISFFLSILIISFSYTNIILFFENAKNKKFNEIFYDLKSTTILLILGILNLAMILPGIGVFNLFLILKELIGNKHIFASIIYFLNFFVLVIFCIKNITPFFKRNHNYEKLIQDEELAHKIEKDLNLKLSSLILCALIFTSPLIIYFNL